jgi:hypothetical protein
MIEDEGHYEAAYLRLLAEIGRTEEQDARLCSHEASHAIARILQGRGGTEHSDWSVTVTPTGRIRESGLGFEASRGVQDPRHRSIGYAQSAAADDCQLPTGSGACDNVVHLAGHYITNLPKAEHEAPELHTAIEALMMVAEHGGDTMLRHPAGLAEPL